MTGRGRLLGELADAYQIHFAWAVERTAAIARAHGFQVPRQYDVGMRIAEVGDLGDRGLEIVTRINNDVTRSFRVQIPDARLAPPLYREKHDALMEELHHEAGYLVNQWTEAHPEWKPRGDKVWSLLEAIQAPSWVDDCIARVDEHMRTVSFSGQRFPMGPMPRSA